MKIFKNIFFHKIILFSGITGFIGHSQSALCARLPKPAVPEKKVAAYFKSKESSELVTEPVEWPIKALYGNPVSRWISPLLGGYPGRCFTHYSERIAHSKDPVVVQKKIDHYQTFYKDVLDMREFAVPKQGFATFNEWFTRSFKDIETARPLSTDHHAVVSPADCKLLIIPNISENTQMMIKEQQFNVAKFLMDDTVAQQFKDGVMMIFRLSPSDYHRYHYPFDSHVGPERAVTGDYHSVNPRAFTAGCKPLTENKRSYELLTPTHNTALSIAMVQVGATAVASIVNHFMDYSKNALKEPANTVYKKGQEMGYFQFGGSTVVLLFPAKSIIPDARIVENSKNGYETAVKVRETIARWNTTKHQN